MNDVLKSLTVLDFGGGVVQSIGYECTQPIAHQLNDIALDLGNEQIFSGLLSQLKGAAVKVEFGDRTIEAVVAGIEQVEQREQRISTKLSYSPRYKNAHWCKWRKKPRMRCRCWNPVGHQILKDGRGLA